MSDETFMRRALDLAALGRGSVSPNPMVGCVVVAEGRIIGEGWHKKYGEAHAEVNALENVKDKSLLQQSTVYVTLEPCAHYGKTPPCADLLIKTGVKKVVVAATDANPLVAGKGIQKIKQAGIEVSTGVLEQESISLNRRFFTFINEKRPFILLKWAETADGYIARKNFDSKWISSPYSRKLVHKWRTEEAAILVGTNTAQFDNPQLTARDWKGKNPLRIVLDRNLRLKDNLNLFDHSLPTICYNLVKDQDEGNLAFVKVEGEKYLENILTDLYQKGVQSVLVEGGSQLMHEFISQGYWDEIRVFKSTKIFGEGIVAPRISGMFVSETELPEGDRLLVYQQEEILNI